jgi:hypothetical protein
LGWKKIESIIMNIISNRMDKGEWTKTKEMCWVNGKRQRANLKWQIQWVWNQISFFLFNVKVRPLLWCFFI